MVTRRILTESLESDEGSRPTVAALGKSMTTVSSADAPNPFFRA
jgi:hypothetical protein